MNEHHNVDDVNFKEDDGISGLLQGIKAALAIELKEKMGVENILKKEYQLTMNFMDKLKRIQDITIIEEKQRKRVGFVSFYHEEIHYNLLVKLLSERYAIQTRGEQYYTGICDHLLVENECKKIEKNL